jgi:hypothetical protein
MAPKTVTVAVISGVPYPVTVSPNGPFCRHFDLRHGEGQPQLGRLLLCGSSARFEHAQRTCKAVQKLGKPGPSGVFLWAADGKI